MKAASARVRELQKELRREWKEEGFLRVLDSTIEFLIMIIRTMLYNRYLARRSYGLLEALFYAREMTSWKRLMETGLVIRQLGKTRILDVGSGGWGISTVLSPRAFQITLFDLNKQNLAASNPFNPHAEKVAGDASHLPFRENSFDVITCIDALEHIPRAQRELCVSEMKSVGDAIIIRMPVQGGSYQGRICDCTLFKYTHAKTTAEHIEAGHSSLDELLGLLPEASYKGTHNINSTYLYTRICQAPIAGLASGLIYWLICRGRDDTPPYWGVMITYRGGHGTRLRRILGKS